MKARPATDFPGTDAPRASFLPEIRISLGYVLLASLWIISSDALVVWITGNGSATRVLQSFKGLGFVVATGILLFFVLRRSFGGWRRAERHRVAEITASGKLFRDLSKRIRSLREDERTRISREIHDELGQRLTGLKLKLRLLEDQLDQHADRGFNPLIDDLVEASSMVDETIDAVRRISSGMRPPMLDDLGLAAALREEAERFARQTGVECVLEVNDLGSPLPAAVQTAAFRIFQESLTNVARHASARRVDAECQIDAGSLVLSVCDDGVGIDPKHVNHPVSLGLVGMLERAADVGGRLEFRTRPECGTEVVLRVPLPSAPAPSAAPPPVAALPL